MASRLSQQNLPAIYDGGCRGLAFLDPKESVFDFVEVEKALDAVPGHKKLSSFAPQAVYHAIMQRGPENCSPDVFSRLSREQVVRIMDYDVWQADSLSHSRFFAWVNLFRRMTPEKAYKTFSHLDEEYKIAALAPFVRIYDPETYEQLSDEEQDRLYRFPSDAFFYEIRSDDPHIHDGIAGLVELILSQDINFAFSILTHAAYLPPQESEDLLAQFRRARLEEDGFVTLEESLSYFQTLPVVIDDTGVMANIDNRAFLEQAMSGIDDASVVDDLQKGWITLSNALCAAAAVEPDDRHHFRYVLNHAKAIAALGLNLASGGSIEKAVSMLIARHFHPKQMWQTGLSRIRAELATFVEPFQADASKRLQKFYRYYTLRQHGLLLDWIDRELVDVLDFQDIEILKGMFNRFPQVPDIQGNTITFRPVETPKDLQTLRHHLQRILTCLKPQ
jgi:hypothetical protein